MCSKWLTNGNRDFGMVEVHKNYTSCCSFKLNKILSFQCYNNFSNTTVIVYGFTANGAMLDTMHCPSNTGPYALRAAAVTFTLEFDGENKNC